METTTTKTPEELIKEEKLAKRREVDAAKRAEAKQKTIDEKPTVVEPVVAKTKEEIIEAAKVAKNQVEIYNLFGKEMKKADYFYKGVVPTGFRGTCGKPVDREELIEVFHKVFKPNDNVLFYKQTDKEVYLVIIPIKYSTEIGDFNDSLNGDFQKHAISFLSEGSVNIDTMRQKLERINKFVKYSDR